MIKTGSRKEYALFFWFSPEIELRLVFTRSFISDLNRKQKRISPTLGASETERAFLCSFKLAASGVTGATVFLPSLPGYRKTRKPSLGSWIRPALCGAGLECFRF